MKHFLNDHLETIRGKGLYRSRKTVSTPQGREIVLNGKKVLSFCSNDYLGLAADTRLVRRAEEAMARYGFGAGASRLVCGNFEEHALLEKELATFKKTEAALLFSSGYMANAGIISALCGREDIVFSDKLNHASIVDGIILSRAEFVRYPHKDMDALESALSKAKDHPRRLIVTDTVFSMDGDVAPLREIVSLAERYDAWVMVDEAHAFGVFGPTGSGLVEELGLGNRVHVQMGTLSKAAGSFGAYCAGSKELVEYLINSARSFIFTTAMPPSTAAASREAIKIVQNEPERRQKLLDNALWLRTEIKALDFDTLESVSPIVPVILKDSVLAVKFSQELLKRGVFVQAIRPPTVPVNMARLRLTVMATHTSEDLARCVEAFRSVKSLIGEQEKGKWKEE